MRSHNSHLLSWDENKSASCFLSLMLFPLFQVTDSIIEVIRRIVFFTALTQIRSVFSESILMYFLDYILSVY